WDGAAWQSVGGNLSFQGDPFGAVGNTMCLFGDSLVVGGTFDQAGALPVNNIVLWDGAAWHAIGDGFTGNPYGYIPAVVNWHSHPVAGGEFTASGSQPLQGAAIWDGASWQQLGNNVLEIASLRVTDGVLLGSGAFRLPDGTELRTVALWTGTDWHVLGSGG